MVEGPIDIGNQEHRCLMGKYTYIGNQGHIYIGDEVHIYIDDERAHLHR